MQMGELQNRLHQQKNKLQDDLNRYDAAYQPLLQDLNQIRSQQGMTTFPLLQEELDQAANQYLEKRLLVYQQNASESSPSTATTSTPIAPRKRGRPKR
jgi:hypothetical protein